MDVPFSNVVVFIMNVLNERNLELKINKQNLNKIVDKIIKEIMIYDEKVNEFNFDEELDVFMSCYNSYFDFEGNDIVFIEDASILEELLYITKEEHSDNYYTDIISDIIISDSTILGLMGIRIRKEYYHLLLDVERNTEKYYMDLSKCSSKDKDNIINKLKILVLKKRIILQNIKNNLTETELDDLISYGSEYAYISDLNNDCDIDSGLVIEPFLRSIFIVDEMYYYNVFSRLKLEDKELINQRENAEKYKFYNLVLCLIDEEIDKVDNSTLYNELLKSKYRLMNSLDTIYDTYLFMGKDALDVNLKANYNFIEYRIKMFIKDILSTKDEDYYFDNESINYKKSYMYLFNLQKKVIIKAYYMLTNDKKVVEEIKKNEMYRVNSISSNMLYDVIKIDKHKKKIL